jgi:succinate-semialdehyde dehydrogenase/glutarate-semialdehyde dehydrogenase
MAIYEPIANSTGPRRKLRVRSPVTLEPIGEFEVATRADVEAALERARKAQVDWAALPVRERARYMDRLLEVVLAREAEILAVVERETGKPRNEALSMEVFSPADSIVYYRKYAERWLRPEKPRVHGILKLAKQLRIVRKPLGVVGIITPWNGPIVLAVNPAVQALLAGNAVVIKPSEVTPFCGQLVGQLFAEAGFPEGLVQVLLGDGETGRALIEARPDKISFTGSVETGRKVGEACGRLLIPCTLELGGKDAMIVCADADLDAAAKGALFGSCMNTGQFCCGTERIYAVDAVHDAFVEKVVAGARELRQADRGEFDVGAMFWDRQLEIVERHVDEARAKGAVVRVGGRRNPALRGLYYEPTVVTDVNHDMALMRDETFGPVISIMRVRDEEEALRLANDSRYGLSGNVWTRDKRKGIELAMRMDTGSVCVNDMSLTYGAAPAPFGGRKQSGVGSVNGPSGLLGYTYAQPILIDRRGKPQVGYPYRLKDADGMSWFMNFLWRRTPLGRWLA